MNRAFFSLALALVLPMAAQAGNTAFECGTPDPAKPEMGAKLVRFDGQDKGTITIGDQEMEAMVLTGLDSLSFLHIGDGFTIQYAVNTKEGFYDYSASGSKMGHLRGECREISG